MSRDKIDATAPFRITVPPHEPEAKTASYKPAITETQKNRLIFVGSPSKEAIVYSYENAHRRISSLEQRKFNLVGGCLSAGTPLKSPHERAPAAVSLFRNAENQLCRYSSKATLSPVEDGTLPIVIANEAFIFVIIEVGEEYVLRLRANVRISGHRCIGAGYDEQIVAAGEAFICQGKLVLFNLKSSGYGDTCVHRGEWINAITAVFGAEALETYHPEVDSEAIIAAEVQQRTEQLLVGNDAFLAYLRASNLRTMRNYQTAAGRRDLNDLLRALNKPAVVTMEPSITAAPAASAPSSPLSRTRGLHEFGQFSKRAGSKVSDEVKIDEACFVSPSFDKGGKNCCIIL